MRELSALIERWKSDLSTIKAELSHFEHVR
jgi:hypothetical protein